MWITIAIASLYGIVLVGQKGNRSKNKDTPATAGSPRRVKREGTPKKGSERKTNTHKLKICSFHPSLLLEAIIYERDEGEDGYLHYIRMFEEDREQNDLLTQLGIVRLVPRRVPNTNNEIMKGKKGYSRNIIIRYVEEPTTSDERMEALTKLRGFFLDSRYSRYPPSKIVLEDLTNSGNAASLDNYFLDEEIETIMREDILEEDLKSSFADDFPDLAEVCWEHNHVSYWAKSLGFPLNGA